MKLKRLLALFVGIALIVFFTLPSMLFGDTGDEYTATGINADYQFQMDSDDADLDPDTDVYCIDSSTPLDGTPGAYIETDQYAIDDLQLVGGNGSSGIPLQDAAAVEIIATSATGAPDIANQQAVWDIIDGTVPSAGTVEQIVEAVESIAEGFVADGGTTHEDLMQYLVDEKVNEIDVTLDSDPLVDSNGNYNVFDATAIMENPLVPEVTDEGKNVFWYILGGSYNVSFSQIDLVVETTSIMNDHNDGTDGDGEDTDSDSTTTDDHYGMASIPYYFYWWGGIYPEFEEMSVNIGACVDIDEDGDIDKEQGEDLDEFNLNANVVQTVLDGSLLHIVETDIDGNVVTAIPDNVDIDYFNAGKVLTTQPEDGEITRQEYPTDQRFVIESYSEPCDGDSETYSAWGRFEVTKTDSVTQGPVAGAVYQLTYISGQTNPPSKTVYTFTTGADGKASVPGLPWGTYELKEFSSPPGYDLDPTVYTLHIGGTALFDEESQIDGSIVVSRDVQNDPRIRESYGSITLNKSGLDATDTAGFTLYDSNGVAVGGEKTVTGNGSVEWSNLPMDTYKIVETTTPAGYVQMADITGIVVDSTQLNYSFDRVNTKKTTTTTTTTTPGAIQVLGIQELPFTGMNPAIPISGASTIFAGGLMVVLSTIRKRFGRK